MYNMYNNIFDIQNVYIFVIHVSVNLDIVHEWVYVSTLLAFVAHLKVDIFGHSSCKHVLQPKHLWHADVL